MLSAKIAFDTEVVAVFPANKPRGQKRITCNANNVREEFTRYHFLIRLFRTANVPLPEWNSVKQKKNIYNSERTAFDSPLLLRLDCYSLELVY